MARPRYQTGHVNAAGRKWRGEYRKDIVQADGSVRRKHQSVVLGLRSELNLSDARRKLSEIISKETHSKPDGRVTLEWFVEHRWLPQMEARWKASTQETNAGLIKHLTTPLGSIPLDSFDKFQLQTHINSMAERGLSYSVIQHVTAFTRDIFAEAEDLEFIVRNPATRLKIPRVVRTRIMNAENGLSSGKPFLSLKQLRRLLEVAFNVKKPDRAIIMLAGLCALRPGEIFGATWGAYTAAGWNVMQRVYRGEIDIPKSEASNATIPLPAIVRAALDKWKADCPDTGEHSYVFATSNGNPISTANFLNRNLHVYGTLTDVHVPVNFQILRRTAATHVSSFGAGLKELQAILRHSASQDFSVSVYQQAIHERVLDVLEKYTQAVASGLPDCDSIELPVEGGEPRSGEEAITTEFCPQVST